MFYNCPVASGVSPILIFAPDLKAVRKDCSHLSGLENGNFEQLMLHRACECFDCGRHREAVDLTLDG